MAGLFQRTTKRSGANVGLTIDGEAIEAQAGMGQRLGGAHARRPGADDDDDRLSQRRHPR